MFEHSLKYLIYLHITKKYVIQLVHVTYFQVYIIHVNFFLNFLSNMDNNNKNSDQLNEESKYLSFNYRKKSLFFTTFIL